MACRYEGAIELPGRGRWFMYLELEQNGIPLEAWLPVQVAAGIVLCVLSAALLRAIVFVFRRQGATTVLTRP